MKEQGPVEDAMHATRAAVAEGILPAVSPCVPRAGQALDSLRLKGDAHFGVDLMKSVDREPCARSPRTAASMARRRVEGVANKSQVVRLQRADASMAT